MYNKFNKEIFKTPILFIIFNRPEKTKKVFNEIAKIRPQKFYIAADGPRKNNYDDATKCKLVREFVIKNITWPCNYKNLFRKDNLGCKKAVSSAIDWFFENEEMGIILEDDCVPDPSFFYFCQELLLRYINDSRVMMINGVNFQDGLKRGTASYFFSKYANVWGWASWKRAWKFYDVNMKSYEDFKKHNRIKDVFHNFFIRQYWIMKLDEVYNGKIDTWDYQWSYTIFSQNGLCITPNQNLVTNIGLDKEATHTKKSNIKLFNLKTSSIREIKHPIFFVVDSKADNYTFKKVYSNFFKVFVKIILRKLKII